MLSGLYDLLQMESHFFGQLKLDAFLFVLNILGTVVFAISGALSGRKHGFDLLGVTAVSFVTTNGGGSVRCMLLGNYPIFWIKDPLWLYLTLCTAILTYFIGPSDESKFPEKLWLVLDAIGLVAFAISGAWVALELHTSVETAILMGMLTGCGGGVLRDIICNTHPSIFHREIYASAALVTAAVFAAGVSFGFGARISALAACCFGLALRLASLRFGWSLHLRRI